MWGRGIAPVPINYTQDRDFLILPSQQENFDLGDTVMIEAANWS